MSLEVGGLCLRGVHANKNVLELQTVQNDILLISVRNRSGRPEMLCPVRSLPLPSFLSEPLTEISSTLHNREECSSISSLYAFSLEKSQESASTLERDQNILSVRE